VVTVQQGHVVEVGPDRHEPAVDLGDVALLPGLVNVHAHLEFSLLSRPLGHAGISLPQWIPLVLEYRRGLASSALALAAGLEESRRCGVRWVGEIATPGWQAEPFAQGPLGGVVYAELLGPRPQDVEPQLARAIGHLQARGPWSERWRPGLAPHAPYTVHPQLFDQAVNLAAAAGAPFAFHLAESPEELEYLQHGSGPLRDLLEARGAWHPGAIPRGTRPLDYLRPMARLARSLVIHGNYLDEEERSFLAAHSDRMALVYCPRTHAHFGHAPYPLARLLATGAAVVLATDGRASAPDLDLWAEVQRASAAHPEVAPRQFVEMVTIHAAKALGLPQAGVLRPGVPAYLLALPCAGGTGPDPYATLLEAAGPPTVVL
jgi:cytosine/adenosine deaminase-related metal-dependent hydrolase